MGLLIDRIGIRGFREEEVEVAGVEMKLASLRENEVECLINMLDKYLYNANDAIKNLVIENIDLIIDLVRAVKTRTRMEFAGAKAMGNQLTIVALTATDLKNVWGATGRTDFTYTATATGAVDYIGTKDQPEATAEEEGIIYLGFIEKAITPKVNKVLLTKNGSPYPYTSLMWDEQEDFYLSPLPEPYFIPPETNYYIRANFYKTGKVEMEPLAFKVVQAKNLLTL